MIVSDNEVLACGMLNDFFIDIMIVNDITCNRVLWIVHILHIIIVNAPRALTMSARWAGTEPPKLVINTRK